MIRRAVLCCALLTGCSAAGGAAVPPSSSRPAPLRPSTSPAAVATEQIRRLTAPLGAGGVSIEAVRPDDGATFRYGADGGMVTGSIAKLLILEGLLLQRSDEHESLDAADQDTATRMIENSDNDAADTLYAEVGTDAGLSKLEARLGLRNTQPGKNYIWGFTTTCASDYIALLRNLIAPSVLPRSSRLFVLNLMANVESDQRWGVSAAADPGTTVQLKNGWIPVDPDHGRWLVNSVGVVTVHGHEVLLAVLTQHGASFAGGVRLVEQLARIAASVVG